MRRILAVDDSTTVLVSIELALKKRGYALDLFQRPGPALESISRAVPDLVITDLNMPEMTGIELIRRVRQLPPPARFVPIVVLTTEGRQAKKEEARKAGATVWITKPFTPEGLEGVVRRLAAATNNYTIIDYN